MARLWKIYTYSKTDYALLDTVQHMGGATMGAAGEGTISPTVYTMVRGA